MTNVDWECKGTIIKWNIYGIWKEILIFAVTGGCSLSDVNGTITGANGGDNLFIMNNTNQL